MEGKCCTHARARSVRLAITPSFLPALHPLARRGACLRVPVPSVGVAALCDITEGHTWKSDGLTFSSPDITVRKAFLNAGR